MEGENDAEELISKIERGHHLPLSAIAVHNIGVEIFRALADLHAQGTLQVCSHPRNVFLMKEGGVIVQDSAASGDLAQNPYLSPARIRDKDARRSENDVWAACLILLELKAGIRLSELFPTAPSDGAGSRRPASMEREAWESALGGVLSEHFCDDPGLAAALRRGLAHDTDSCPTAEQMLDALSTRGHDRSRVRAEELELEMERLRRLVMAARQELERCRRESAAKDQLLAAKEHERLTFAFWLREAEAEVRGRDVGAATPAAAGARGGGRRGRGRLLSRLFGRGGAPPADGPVIRRPPTQREGKQLRQSALDGDLDTVRALLQSGVDQSHLYCLNGPVDWRPLHLAAWRGHYEVVQLLLAYGAEIDVTADIRTTPLQRACLHCHRDVVRLLVENGANVVHQNQWGITAAEMARKEDPELADALDLCARNREAGLERLRALTV